MKIKQRALKRDIRRDEDKLHCEHLGEMTREDFNTKHFPNVRVREYQNNKVTVHFEDKTVLQYSFTPIIRPLPRVTDDIRCDYPTPTRTSFQKLFI